MLNRGGEAKKDVAIYIQYRFIGIKVVSDEQHP